MNCRKTIIKPNVLLKLSSVITLGLLVSIYCELELGRMNICEDLKFLWSLLLLLVCAYSFTLCSLIILSTLQHKGYPNLLWFALPVLVLCSIEGLFRFPTERPALLTLFTFTAINYLVCVAI